MFTHPKKSKHLGHNSLHIFLYKQYNSLVRSVLSNLAKGQVELKVGQGKHPKDSLAKCISNLFLLLCCHTWYMYWKPKFGTVVVFLRDKIWGAICIFLKMYDDLPPSPLLSPLQLANMLSVTNKYIFCVECFKIN